MRILHVVEASFAGVGRHVLDLARGQAARGHEVHVAFSPVRESDSFRSERLDLTEVTFHPVVMQRSPGLSDVPALVALDRLVRSVRPDVVHTHSSKAGLLGRVIGGRGVLRVHTPHAVYSMNPMMSPRSRAAMGWIEAFLGNHRSDVVIAVSPEEVDHLTTIGVEASRVRMVANGIDTVPIADRGVVRGELGVPATGSVIGFVGRLSDQKDPLRLIDAFDRLSGHDGARLVVVGDGPLWDQACDRVERCSSGDRIHLVGEQPGLWSMAAFDLFVLPSRYEGFPYVVLEAAAHSLPIVTTYDAGASQLVEDGVSGWLIPSGDTDRLTEALEAALAHPHPETIGAAARERSEEFTEAAMVDGVLTVIDRLQR